MFYNLREESIAHFRTFIHTYIYTCTLHGVGMHSYLHSYITHIHTFYLHAVGMHQDMKGGLRSIIHTYIHTYTHREEACSSNHLA